MPYVAAAAERFLNTSVGSGQCVPLVEVATGAPLDVNWSQGEVVRNATDIAPGTAIATFDDDGTYGNHTDGSSHAAIYMGQNDTGLQVIDQWVSVVNHQRVVQVAHRRTIAFRGGAGRRCNDGDQFCVVE